MWKKKQSNAPKLGKKLFRFSESRSWRIGFDRDLVRKVLHAWASFSNLLVHNRGQQRWQEKKIDCLCCAGVFVCGHGCFAAQNIPRVKFKSSARPWRLVPGEMMVRIDFISISCVPFFCFVGWVFLFLWVWTYVKQSGAASHWWIVWLMCTTYYSILRHNDACNTVFM